MRSKKTLWWSHLTTTVFCYALLSLMPSSAGAEDADYFDLPPEQLLNAEVISVSKKTEKVSDSAAAVYIISQEDILRSGIRSVPEALRMVPGVQVAQADANSWAISIRGFNNVNANKLLVMVDGRTVYNPLFAGTYWELQDLLLEDIDRIEVIRGPGGSLWGANAVNGVINIITKNSQETQDTVLTAAYGTQDNGTLTGRYGGAFGDDNYYRVYGKYFDRDSFKKRSGANGDDDWQSGRGGFRMDLGNEVTVQGDVYRTLTDQLNSTPTMTSTLIEEETMESEGANILGRWKKDLGDGSLLTVQSYLDYTTREQILLNDKRVIFDIEAQYNFAPTERHDMAFGGGYRYTHDDLDSTSIVSFLPPSRSDDLFNVFFQDSIALIPEEWYLTLGSKFEHNDYTGVEVQPNARLQWHPDAAQTVWASVSRAVRTPSRLEHDLNIRVNVLPPATSVILSANPDFESEELLAYELGYRNQVTRDFAVDVAAFYNDYDQLGTIGALGSTPGVLSVHQINGMAAETYGAEIAAEWKLMDNLELSASYSYLQMQLHGDGNNPFAVETDEGRSPHHQASARLSWNITDAVSLDTSTYYVSRLKTDNVDDYVRLDMNLGWRIDDNARFNLIGQNLLQDSHREFSAPTALNATEVERSIIGKMTWRF